MNWYKRAKDIKEIKDHFERILGLGKYRPPSMTRKEKEEWEKKRKKRKPYHSMDMGGYEGEDDGW